MYRLSLTALALFFLALLFRRQFPGLRAEDETRSMGRRGPRSSYRRRRGGQAEEQATTRTELTVDEQAARTDLAMDEQATTRTELAVDKQATS